MKLISSLLFPATFSGFKNNWQLAWSKKNFKIKSAFTLLQLILLILFVPPFFQFIQNKQGSYFNDFLLNMLQARNMSLYIFLLIYSVIILGIVNIISYPEIILKSFQAYCLLLLMRIICIYLIPLEADRGIISLQDPIIGKYIYKGIEINKDLFFSGHVSTMFLIYLIIPYRFLKFYFLSATILVAFFLLIQHVHYSIDIFASPLFAWLSYKLIFKTLN